MGASGLNFMRMRKMERLLSVKDIQSRYQCSPATARKYMRQMVHMEQPMMVSEKAVAEWESGRLYFPADLIRQRMREKR